MKTYITNIYDSSKFHLKKASVFSNKNNGWVVGVDCLFKNQHQRKFSLDRE